MDRGATNYYVNEVDVSCGAINASKIIYGVAEIRPETEYVLNSKFRATALKYHVRLNKKKNVFRAQSYKIHTKLSTHLRWVLAAFRGLFLIITLPPYWGRL